MKDHKDQQSQPESQTYLDKLEQATPTQAAMSIIAKVMQAIKSTQSDDSD